MFMAAVIRLKESRPGELEERLKVLGLTYAQAAALELFYAKAHRSPHANFPVEAVTGGVPKSSRGAFKEVVEQLARDGYITRYGGRESYCLTRRGMQTGQQLETYRPELRLKRKTI